MNIVVLAHRRERPVLAGRAELGGLRAFPAVGLSYANGNDVGIDEGEYHVAGQTLECQLLISEAMS